MESNNAIQSTNHRKGVVEGDNKSIEIVVTISIVDVRRPAIGPDVVLVIKVVACEVM